MQEHGTLKPSWTLRLGFDSEGGKPLPTALGFQVKIGTLLDLTRVGDGPIANAPGKLDWGHGNALCSVGVPYCPFVPRVLLLREGYWAAASSQFSGRHCSVLVSTVRDGCCGPCRVAALLCCRLRESQTRGVGRLCSVNQKGIVGRGSTKSPARFRASSEDAHGLRPAAAASSATAALFREKRSHYRDLYECVSADLSKWTTDSNG